MKLVDILARELETWPEGVFKIMQTFAGMTFYQDAAGQIVPLLRISLADDWRLEDGVTREQWQSAVNATKPNVNCRTLTMTKPQLPPGVIPIGATHFHHNPVIEKPTSNPWRKRSGAGWMAFYDGEWRGCNGSKAHLFVAIEDVLGKSSEGKWDWYGLPPVGTVCEFDCGTHDLDDPFDKDLSVGAQVTIIAHIADGDIAVFTFNPGNPNRGQIAIDMGRYGCFRPIRTAEQIAAEIYQKDLQELADHIGGSLGFEEAKPSHVKVAEYLLDHGYRKQVQE